MVAVDEIVQAAYLKHKDWVEHAKSLDGSYQVLDVPLVDVAAARLEQFR